MTEAIPLLAHPATGQQLIRLRQAIRQGTLTVQEPQVGATVPDYSPAQGAMALQGSFSHPGPVLLTAPHQIRSKITVVARMEDLTLRPAVTHMGKDAGPAGGDVRAALQTLDRDNVPLPIFGQGGPGPALRWGMDKSGHQQVVPPVGRPEQLQTCHRGAFTQFITNLHQCLGR